MKKVIRKIFFVWQYEKEEQWLNEMSAKGWQLTTMSTGKIGKYVFEKGAPNEYEYRLEFLDKDASSPESDEYISFLKETNIEMIGACRNWIYIRKKTAEGGFQSENKLAYNLTHNFRLGQELQRVQSGLFVANILSILFIILFHSLPQTDMYDFLEGFFTGILIASSILLLIFIPIHFKINRKIKNSLKEFLLFERI